MYDDLIKRLQEDKPSRRMTLTAADAIEELCDLCASLSKDCSEAVAKYLELLEKQPRWIPVSERLPEDDRLVLVTYLGYNDHKPRANMLAYIGRNLGWCWWNDDIPYGTSCAVEITHWMPLPEPPKEET